MMPTFIDKINYYFYYHLICKTFIIKKRTKSMFFQKKLINSYLTILD
jgi:hypothetical protein